MIYDVYYSNNQVVITLKRCFARTHFLQMFCHWLLLMSVKSYEQSVGAGPSQAVYVYGHKQPSSGASPHICPYSKWSAMGADIEEEELKVLGGDLRRGGLGLLFAIHRTDTVTIICFTVLGSFHTCVTWDSTCETPSCRTYKIKHFYFESRSYWHYRSCCDFRKASYTTLA